MLRPRVSNPHLRPKDQHNPHLHPLVLLALRPASRMVNDLLGPWDVLTGCGHEAVQVLRRVALQQHQQVAAGGAVTYKTGGPER